MKINKRNRLESARVVDSPNFSDRLHEEISLLVIHNISLPPGEFGNHFVNDFFTYTIDFLSDVNLENQTYSNNGTPTGWKLYRILLSEFSKARFIIGPLPYSF